LTSARHFYRRHFARERKWREMKWREIIEEKNVVRHFITSTKKAFQNEIKGMALNRRVAAFQQM
jgi:hypothetical protein